MAEYIEREAVINQFESNGGYFTYGKTTVKAIVSRIKMQPAADVEPVRRGHWIINSDGYYPQCSECMKEPQGRVMTDWCPNCGARMKGEENGRY